MLRAVYYVKRSKVQVDMSFSFWSSLRSIYSFYYYLVISYVVLPSDTADMDLMGYSYLRTNVVLRFKREINYLVAQYKRIKLRSLLFNSIAQKNRRYKLE